MSADNGIYILKTKDSYKHVGYGVMENQWGEGIITYRVAHAQAIDDLYWYEENQPYSVGFFLYSVWGDVIPIYDESEAFKEALKLSKTFSILEYGISEIDRTQYCFPGS